jgi:hypothetical protein
MSGHADDDRRHSASRHIKVPPGAIYNAFMIRYLCMLATAHLQQGAAEAGLRVIAEAKESGGESCDRCNVSSRPTNSRRIACAVRSSQYPRWRVAN